ncbi:hypothetical protein BUE76_20655 [Cnuella takakiae]|nr:hypothetical protein BUE76_20655 [Cnuella takakiae]
MALFLQLVPAKESAAQLPDAPASDLVRLSFRNNSWLFRKFTLVTYKPGADGNDATSLILAPGMRKSMQLTVGTRVYNASSKQVAVVMSGVQLRDKPLLVVSAKDAGAVVPLLP